MATDHAIGYLVRPTGERIALGWNEGLLDAVTHVALTDDEVERIELVNSAIGDVNLDTWAEGEPILLTFEGDPCWSDIVGAWQLAHHVTPRKRAVVDLVARGWAISQYRYPLGWLTAEGEAMLVDEASRFDEAQVGELVESLRMHVTAFAQSERSSRIMVVTRNDGESFEIGAVAR